MRARRLLPVMGLLVVSTTVASCGLLTGGSAPHTSPAPSTSPSSAASSARPSPSASATSHATAAPTLPSLSSTKRPLATVPSVRPGGFSPPPAGSGFARYTAQRPHWTSCGGGVQCAKLLVPLDYASPDGQAITLALARRVSTASHPKGELFVNPGGPGGSGVDLVRSFRPAGLGAYTIISWDPRGVGDSTPVECENGAAMDRYTALDSSPDTRAEIMAFERANLDFGRSCLSRSGKLLEHVSTQETVRDLDLLRTVTGSSKLDYLGFSYGTAIGARYAQTYPTRVGRMVLDGAVSLGASGGVSQAVGFDRALRDFAGWAATQRSKLGSSRTAVLKTITRLWDRLDAKPLVIKDGRNLTQSLAVTGTTSLLYENANGYRYLDSALTAAVDGDGRLLRYYADQYDRRAPNGSFGQLNYAFPAIRCLDSRDGGIKGALADWKADRKNARDFGRYFGPDFTCPTWPVAARPGTPKSTDAAGAPPILVLGTTRDPATPYENAVAMAKQLKSGRLLTLRGEGHLAYDQSACIRGKVDAFLVSGKLPARGTVCPS